MIGGNWVTGCLLVLLLMGGIAEASFFLAEEEREDVQKTKTVKIHKVDTVTKKVLFTQDIPRISRMLSGDGTRLFATDGYDVYEYRTNDLALHGEYNLPLKTSQDYLFVHPRTGVFYFTTTTGSMPNKVLLVDPSKKTVTKQLRTLFGVVRGGFTYDPKRQWVWVDSTAPFAIHPNTHKTIHIIDLKELLTEPPFDLRPQTFSILGTELYPLPDGGLLLGPDVKPVSPAFAPLPTVLFVYDPERGAVVCRSGSLPPLYVQSLSRDGMRLFASTSSKVGAGVIIDTRTLAIMHTPNFPEPVKQFLPAPNGQGMWMVANSGKIYRLDDRTGQVLEQVSLPFRVSKIILLP